MESRKSDKGYYEIKGEVMGLRRSATQPSMTGGKGAEDRDRDS